MAQNLAARQSPPQCIALGEMQPSEADTVAWVREMVQRQRSALLGKRLPVSDGVALQRLPPTEAEFLEGVKRAQAIRKALTRGEYDGTQGAATVAQQRGERYSPTTAGYVQFLTDFYDRLGMGHLFSNTMAQTPRPVLDPRARVGHTSIVGGSGAGKSELMKALALHDIQSGAAVVVIDPHATFARQVARWPEVAETGRLVWMGQRHGDTTARLNPLDARGMSQADKEKAAYSLVTTLGDVVNEAEPTNRMAAMAANCVRLLMEYEGSTLLTFRDMLTPHGAKEWAERGAQHPSENVAYYFKNEFLTREKDVTRNGLRDRLLNFTGSDGFTSRFCQPSTIDLGALIEARKVIVFDLYDLTDLPQVAAARLILGTLAGWAKRRDVNAIDRAVPVHVYLDEAGPILSTATATLLRETRKMGVYLTLASQRSNDDMRRGTAVRCAGGGEWRHALADTPAVHGKDDKNTPRGVFWVNWANKTPIKITVRSDLRDDVRGVGADVWARTLEAQRAAYYRPTVARQEATAKAADAAPKRVRRKPD